MRTGGSAKEVMDAAKNARRIHKNRVANLPIQRKRMFSDL
jgi:hypothetical protein